MIKAIIFDCFDVLIGDATKVSVAKLMEVNPSRAEEFRAVTHAVDKGVISVEEAVTSQADLLGMTVEAFNDFRNKGEIRNEELITYIETLKGKFKLGMVSNINSRERLDIRFLPGQLDQLFDVVIPSGGVGYIKPQPEIFEIALEKLGVAPEECVMIDDIEAFCEGARAVGMHAIQYVNNQQCITDLTDLIDRGGKTD